MSDGASCRTCWPSRFVTLSSAACAAPAGYWYLQEVALVFQQVPVPRLHVRRRVVPDVLALAVRHLVVGGVRGAGGGLVPAGSSPCLPAGTSTPPSCPTARRAGRAGPRGSSPCRRRRARRRRGTGTCRK